MPFGQRKTEKHHKEKGQENDFLGPTQSAGNRNKFMLESLVALWFPSCHKLRKRESRT